MKKHISFRTIDVSIVLVLLSGCSAPATQAVSIQPDQGIQVIESSSETVSFTETIRINNCGGKSESEQVSERSFSTNIEGAVELQIGYEIIEGSVTAKYGQYRNVSKSHKLSAPPGTNMEFVLRWTEQTWRGSIIANNKSGSYRVHVPISVEQVSGQDLGCGTFSTPISQLPVNPSPTSNLPSPTIVQATTSPKQILSDGDTAYGNGLSLKASVVCLADCGNPTFPDYAPLITIKYVLTNTSGQRIIIPKFGGDESYVALDTGERLYVWTSIGWCDRDSYIESQSLNAGESIKWEWGYKLKNDKCGGVGDMLPLPNTSRTMTIYFPEIGERFAGAIWQIEIPR
ncbi:MAG: hypothetical protein ACOYYF_16225 [Chloroflexota bacterium]|nr:hypothetical protein [Chloroflexota bacterium]MBI5703917.1 hypothetical protein [Chloroflexota bacterium]